MNFEDYVRHMTQKYSIAVAIGVLKTKPENVPTQEFIETLRNKITDKQMDIDDIDICSDDFNFDDSFNQNDDTMIEDDANDSVTVLRDFEFEENEESNSMADVLKLIRVVDEETETEKTKNSQNLYATCITQPTTSKAYNFCNITNTNNVTEDSGNIPENNTTIYVVNAQNEVNMTKLEDSIVIDNNNTKIHEDSIIIDNMTIDNDSIVIDSRLADVIFKNLNKNHNLVNMSPEIENIYQWNKIDSQVENSDHTENFIYNDKDKMIQKVKKNLNKDNSQTEIMNGNSYVDLQDTELYSLQGFTQNCTHVSQSQDNDIEIGKKFIVGNRRLNNKNDIAEIDCKNSNSVTDKEGQVINISNIVQIVENNGRKYLILNETNTQKEYIKNDANSQIDTQEMFEESTSDRKHHLGSKEGLDHFEEEHYQTELVPFKIIEELNKIKTVLNKSVHKTVTDGSSSDSGYRSDSQSRSSFKSAQNWLNQSAHCLFNYLLQCPLVATTEDIVNEIAVVLGKLIDRLHEEEKYPSFLEDILENIDVLLLDIFEGDCSGENLALKKDENIQRMLLLNKSLHILKYTIEKITNLLEKLHSNLTREDSMYELTNVQETENACYIFHLLEIILKRYMKVKDSSQTQPSQEDKLLKKSSITDIWRKKWNPNYKEIDRFENSEKQCVLVKCSEILNRMIVEGINGYSLIAFTALQCFNLLHETTA